MSFREILEKYRKTAFSERDKGSKFERLMQAYLKTDLIYASKLKEVWLWNEFPQRDQFGGNDTGIDLVALTSDGDYWAIQCKFYQESSTIDKPAVDSFLATSSREFNVNNVIVKFSLRLWISTGNYNWNHNAEQAITNQNPQVIRINLYNLINAPVDWDELDKGITGIHARNNLRNLMKHQEDALKKTNEYFKENTRGKLIMACGTGKTFNSLRIAENETSQKGFVLFLVPSIALLSQTLREWTTFAQKNIYPVCICSDSEVSKKKTKAEDNNTFNVIDLALPASTDVENIINQINKINSQNNNGMTVVFSTYQSIDVISKVQKKLNFEFDLIICDEAHRTTGITLANDDESAFTKVHDNEFIKAKKRLYMTATPKLYSDEIKSKVAKAEAVLCSMDDESVYGKEIYRIGFGEAVEKGLLTDYKVLILTLNEKNVPAIVQNMVANSEKEINTDDASKLVGCINALSKQILGDNGIIEQNDPEPMRRAVAFCQKIVDSKKITNIFNTTTDAYINSLPDEKQQKMVYVGSKHIDGTMSAPQRDELLGWLKDESENNQCRLLTNVRCLSEGVDVPSLDAVLFLSARNSQVDVVQSVGRVMRKAPNKKYGYIIIPIVVPSDMNSSEALDKNENYKVVWSVLNALRAHDDRFNAIVNKIELNKYLPDQILVGSPETAFDTDGNPVSSNDDLVNKTKQLTLPFEELQKTIFAKIVDKVGDRRYWEDWAKSVAEIAERQIKRIQLLIEKDETHKEAFNKFLKSLHNNINPSITQQETIEMLSQHIITKPVFEALFEDYSFVKNNPISKSMQKMLDLLEGESVEKDTETLENFYESVKMRASGIDNAEGKQKIIIELYDKFFKTAFPKMVEKLGIVYTPVEVVDFIIHSVDDILKKEFNRCLSDENVHILDPFTGTGTFITRLLQSGLIDKKDLQRKYTKEIHANEIVLLAYYIAAVNIENSFHDAMKSIKDNIKYTAFDGICLTDTFQLGEEGNNDNLFTEMFPQNSERVQKQKKTPLTVIIGNPPYSIGQKSANDNAQNQKYTKLDNKIAETYAKQSNAGLNKSLYDAYIKAFRWSSDRIDKTGGVICFVSNGAWLDGNSTDGFRKCLEKEFTSIYVFNLRGNQRTSGELSRKEGGKIFGSGSRTPISITLLVKNPNVKTEKAIINYYDIGDYLNREEKLKRISKIYSMNNITEFKILEPNKEGDWISQRNNIFETFIPIEPDEKFNHKTNSFFNTSSLGLGTNRDSFIYNSSITELKSNIINLIEFYNKQRIDFHNLLLTNNKLKVEDFLLYDSKKLNWTDSVIRDLKNNIVYKFDDNYIVKGSYRPFNKQFVYYKKELIHRTYQQLKLFPNSSLNNIVICLTGIGSSKEFSILLTNTIPDIQVIMNGQCFPLYYYEEVQKDKNKSLFQNNSVDYIKRDGVSDFILERSHKQYNAKNITKEDIFYYVYGFLHNPEYKEKFANDLKKMLPRIPLVESVKDFWDFSKSGRKLADLHINYEKISPYEDVEITNNNCGNYIVNKMKFIKKDQKDTIIYNENIVISKIPLKAYEYIVNGKSAIEWIMERYQITTHSESGITNDPNDWAKETEKPRYILDLLLSIINVSVQTVDIINSLPKLNFDEKTEG